MQEHHTVKIVFDYGDENLIGKVTYRKNNTTNVWSMILYQEGTSFYSLKYLSAFKQVITSKEMCAIILGNFLSISKTDTMNSVSIDNNLTVEYL